MIFLEWTLVKHDLKNDKQSCNFTDACKLGHLNLATLMQVYTPVGLLSISPCVVVITWEPAWKNHGSCLKSSQEDI